MDYNVFREVYFMANNTLAAGRIVGNPLCGLCERVCIETKKIFDGCITRLNNITYTERLTDIPVGFTPPYTFVGAQSSGATVITDLVVTQIEGRRSRLTFNTVIPIAVQFTDAVGALGQAFTNITLSRDIILNVPDNSVFPYSVEAATNFVSLIGSFGADNATVTFTGCLVQIVRIVTVVEMLVPSYGYCEYPECREYTDRSCEALLDLPVFPPSNL